MNYNYKNNNKYVYFEILIVDVSEKTVVHSEKDLCLSLMSNGKLFKDINQPNDNVLIDKESNIKIVIHKVNIEKDDKETTEIKQAFTLTVSSSVFESLESIRLKILEYLKNIDFDVVYVLEDDISLMIAKRIYPSIYKVESFLRKYVIKFFVIKLGPEWWKLTAGSEMIKKTINRKRNETVFSRFIDNEVYLIDFGELGELIYSQSSGNLSREHIVDKIIGLEEKVESLIELKEEIQSNYNKFFKSTFKENNFQQDWEDLEKLRHKVAHNGLFTNEDEQNAKKLTGHLIRTIKEANNQIDKVSFSTTDKQYLMSSFINFNYNNLTREILRSELKESMNWVNEKGDGFLGYQNFVLNVMGKKGYVFEETRELLNVFEKEKIIEFYKYFNSEKNEREVRAIRLNY